MSNMKNGNNSFWRGMSTLTASVLTISVATVPVINSFRTDIDKFLGTKSMIIVEGEATDENLYTFKSDYSSTTELLDSIEDLGERMSEEGSVLLKNNGALPLEASEKSKISLLGYASYNPARGGSMGSSLAENVGTDADTVDLVQAFTAKGYEINLTLKNVYEALKENVKTSAIMPWGQAFDYYFPTAANVGETFSSKEPSLSDLTGVDTTWKDSMEEDNVIIITLGRGAGENADWPIGEAGVDPTQNLNQSDPLALSDKERDLIKTAIESKEANGGKLIVLLNNASTMEIDEIKNNDGVDAILQIGLPGGYGFYGVADILSGDVNPSGHLTNIYAVDNSVSPAAMNYGNLPYTNPQPEKSINSALVEAEGIYIGYRYYETRYADTVMGNGNASSSVGSSTKDGWSYDTEVSYPFGYGLSYTTFDQKLNTLEVDLESKTVTAEVTVTNTGTVAGKDAVQLYVSLPYTEYDKINLIEKSAIQLLDYEKTEEIQPGESQTVTIIADAQDMASWDSTIENIGGTTGTYILDDGSYHFSVGNGSHEALNNVLAKQGYTVEGGNAENVKTWNLNEFDKTSFAYSNSGVLVENQLEDMDLNYYIPNTVTYLTRNNWEGTFPITYSGLTATEEMLEILDNDTYDITTNGTPTDIIFGASNGLALADLKGEADIENQGYELLLDQITLEECLIRTGFGGTSSKAIPSIMSPEAIQNDGPNGINSYTLGQYANYDKTSKDSYIVAEGDPNLNYKFGTMTNATVIAQTFNKKLAREFGEVCGNYSIWSNLTIFWGAGTNLHRLPYNARNHEYYSEDPVLSAGQGASYIEGGLEYGLIIAPKHIAFNDTEVNRTGVSVFMTEQKARETELRGVQSCIEDAKALGAMTAYNRVGVYNSNSHTGLLIDILREEWGFKGLLTEDFIMDANYVSLKEAVINGVTMSCNTGDNTMAAVSEKYDYWTVENVSKDATLLSSLKQAMLYQNYALANSNAMDGLSSNSYFQEVRTWYDNLVTGVQMLFTILTLGSLFMLFKKNKNGKGQEV